MLCYSTLLVLFIPVNDIPSLQYSSTASRNNAVLIIYGVNILAYMCVCVCVCYEIKCIPIFNIYLTFKNPASYTKDGRTATLQMLHFIYIFLTNIITEYFKHAAHSPFFSSKCLLFHNATFFGSSIIHILHTECAKI
jgi:hypothetical protein